MHGTLGPNQSVTHPRRADTVVKTREVATRAPAPCTLQSPPRPGPQLCSNTVHGAGDAAEEGAGEGAVGEEIKLEADEEVRGRVRPEAGKEPGGFGFLEKTAKDVAPPSSASFRGEVADFRQKKHIIISYTHAGGTSLKTRVT